jgi:hypothetical protein
LNERAVTSKAAIIQRLGEQAVLLPSLLADALAANERIKLRLTLLQEAASHAQHPDQRPLTLEAERRAAGLDDARYDQMVVGARALSPDRILAPGVSALLVDTASDLSALLAPLQVSDGVVAQQFDDRLKAIRAALPHAENDELAVCDIDAITSASRGTADSVHLLVMDAHKALNHLAAETAIESIDGAHVHHLEEADRGRIKAFMAGLNRTASLAFGHPGLETTATRVGKRLTIQNDIGATDAHVLVIHVEDEVVSITYTDVHRLRAKFFMALFEGQGASWSPLAEHSASGLAGGDVFYLMIGHFSSTDKVSLNRFLEYLGSRIVFLIDWNKARKALQTFIGKTSAIDVLTWAAMHDYGHRAFLELGGVDLIFEAVRRVAAGHIPYGARLDDTLGATESADFLRRVLRQTSEGLLAGRSIRLIRDEVQADLSQLFDTAEAAVLTVLVRHLGLSRMLASTLADGFAVGGFLLEAKRADLAIKSKRIEEKADQLTVTAREICARTHDASNLRLVIDEIENVTDVLDESAFLLSLFPQDDRATTFDELAELSAIAIDGISHLVRAVEAASRLPQGHRSDAADSLQAIDAVIDAERRADEAQRGAFSAFMQRPATDARGLVLRLEIARALETATDHLAHAALSLRDRVLEELSA